MAEAPNGRVALEQTTDRTSPSTEKMKSAIRETRNRLAVQLARTADHVHVLFTTPSSAETEARDGGLIGRAIKTIGVAGRAKRVWSDVRRKGLLRRAAIGGVTVAVAAALATRRRRRWTKPIERPEGTVPKKESETHDEACSTSR